VVGERRVRGSDEVRALRQDLARSGSLPAETVAEVLVQLEWLLAKQDRERRALDRLRGPWLEVRRLVGDLVDLHDAGTDPTTPPRAPGSRRR
jgi:hypothetical protein